MWTDAIKCMEMEWTRSGMKFVPVLWKQFLRNVTIYCSNPNYSHNLYFQGREEGKGLLRQISNSRSSGGDGDRESCDAFTQELSLVGNITADHELAPTNLDFNTPWSSSANYSRCAYIAPCKGVQDSLSIWIPRLGFQIPGTITWYHYIVNGTWILDSNRWWDSGFHK